MSHPYTPRQSRPLRRTRRSHRPAVATLEARQLLSGTTLDEFLLPNRYASPVSIVSGPDGNLWFGQGDSKVGRITPSGTLTEFSIPKSADGRTVNASQIINGPGDDLWFLDTNNTYQIGQITSQGVITEFALPASVFEPDSITEGADGNIWFSYLPQVNSPDHNSIGRLNTDGTTTLFATPTTLGHASSIEEGADGNLHYLNAAASTLGTITPTGQITERILTSAPNPVSNLITASDGALWYNSRSDTDHYSLVRIALDGSSSVVPDVISPTTLKPGPAGSIYYFGNAFQPYEKPTLNQISAAGATTLLATFQEYSGPSCLATGSDGNLWISEASSSLIGRYDLNAAPPVTPMLVGVGADDRPLTGAGYDISIPIASYRADAATKLTNATIDWGDGSVVTTGQLDSKPFDTNNNSFVNGSVAGSHLYTTPGTYHGLVTVTGTTASGDPISTTIPTDIVVAGPTPVAYSETFSAGAGIERTNILAAMFQTRFYRDSSGTDFVATIDWGDGTGTTTGTIGLSFAGYAPPFGIVPNPRPDGSADTFGVFGSHTYAIAGTYTVHVVINDAKSQTVAVDSTATVAATPFILDPGQVNTTINPVLTSTPYSDGYITSNAISFTGLDQLTLAGITDFRVDASTRTYQATINWGDGSPTTVGSICPDLMLLPTDGPSGNYQKPFFDLSGTHVYTQPGTYTIHYTVTDADGNSVAGLTTATVLVERGVIIAASPTPIEVPVGKPTTGLEVGTLSTSDALETAASFTGTIDWGDGSAPSVATFVFTRATGGADLFQISGNHQYASPGSYQATIRVTTADGSTFVTQQGIDAVQAVATSLQAYPPTTNSKLFGSSDPIPIATFSSPNSTATPGDFTATIDWGDGSAPIQGIIQVDGRDVFGNLQFRVGGIHNYLEYGTYSVRITLTDGTAATSSVIGTIRVVPIYTGTSVTPTIATKATSTSTPFVGPIALHFDRVGLPGNFFAGWTLKASQTLGHASVHHHPVKPVVTVRHAHVATSTVRRRVVAKAVAINQVAVSHGQKHPVRTLRVTTHR